MRFKVWKSDPDGEPGTLLLRTGTHPSEPDFGDCDAFNAGATPEDVAAYACDRTGIFGDVLVKNFDTGEWFTITVEKDKWPRVFESTLVGLATAEVATDPVHMACIGHLLEQAAKELEREEFYRCTCRGPSCCINQIKLRAWHLAWARWRLVGVIAARAESQ